MDEHTISTAQPADGSNTRAQRSLDAA